MKKNHLLLTFLIAATFLIGGGLMAQTTIELGTDASNNANIPFNVSYKYSISEQLYTAAEITGATGFANGKITKIYFYSKAAVSRKIDIFIKHTTKTALSSSYDYIPALSTDLVYSSGTGSISFAANEWTEISLSTPFEYDGSSNIVVIIDDNTNTKEESAIDFSTYYSSTKMTLYRCYDWSDLNPYNTPLVSANSLNYKNHIKLTFEPVTYPRPITLNASAVTGTTATLSWAAMTGSSPIKYEYQYKVDGESWSSVEEVTETSVNLNSLISTTDYFFQVRAVYSGNNPSSWTIATFTTDCDDLSIPTTTWNFDDLSVGSYVPDCWQIAASNGTYPRVNSGNAHSNSKCIQFSNSASDQILLMPAIDKLSGNRLTFFAKGSNTPSALTVGYFNSSGVFTPIKNDFSITETYPAEAFYVDFTNLDDVKKIAIKGSTKNGYLYLDDVQIIATPSSCTPVSSPTVGTVTYNSAQLSWTAGDETNWKLQYRESGEENWATVNVSSANFSAGVYTLSGLSENTTYEWQVAAWCDTSDDDDISTYVAGEDFSTPAQYPMPTGLTADNITANSADITWTAGSTETAWQLYYSQYDYANPGNASPGDYINISTTPAYSMTGLTRNTTYYVYVRANYGDDHYSSWTAAEDFTTECGTFALPYTYDFEDPSDLDCWTLEHAYPGSDLNPPTDISYDYSHSSSYSFKFQYGYNYGTQYLISPELSGTSLGVQVELYHKQTFTGATISIGYSTTNNASGSFTWIAETTNQVHDFDAFKCYCPFNTKYVAIRLNSTATSVYIDDISFTTFDKVSIGEYWYNTTDWNPVGVPSAEDNVYIQHEMTIPNDCTASANNITIGESGSLTIADGGQLNCNNAVEVTAQKSISAATNWGTETSYTPDAWYFIASPINSSLTPAAAGLITGDFDLYRYDATNEVSDVVKPWVNYKTGDFTLTNGQGYLYANAANQTLAFTGPIKPYSTSDNTVTLTRDGWNLIGNPYTFAVNVDKAFNEVNKASVPTAKAVGSTINPCVGIAVYGSNGDVVTFTKPTELSSAPSSNNIQMVLAQTVATRGGENMETIDNAIVSFNEGSELPKFYFGSQNANIYIPMDNEEYAIAYSDQQGEMPVNFKAYENGQYTLTVNPENVEVGYLHLIDNIAGKEVDLIANPSYTFNARTDDYESRFRLVFSAQNDNAELGDDFAFISNGQIILNEVTENASLQVIDMMGRIVSNQQVNGNSARMTTVANGVYVLRLIEGNNVRNQKVIIK